MVINFLERLEMKKNLPLAARAAFENERIRYERLELVLSHLLAELQAA